MEEDRTDSDDSDDDQPQGERVVRHEVEEEDINQITRPKRTRRQPARLMDYKL